MQEKDMIRIYLHITKVDQRQKEMEAKEAQSKSTKNTL